jgi:alkanesulfonate monooxygenase SsuD/methylene tetrahydromethanopterin reductase-like flavin-dependent oxidoreductase (luciferase family)
VGQDGNREDLRRVPERVVPGGPARVVDLAKAIEAIGYDDLAMFDHVIMGYATDTRRAPMYPSQMPILEALVTLGFVAAVTERVTLATECRPTAAPGRTGGQAGRHPRHAVGRAQRLGIGVGWQEAEYEALGEDFTRRGPMMDEAIGLLRACWGEERIDRRGERFHANVIAMEPKPPNGERLPIWIGGSAPAALRRTGRLGDGWIRGPVTGDDDRDRAPSPRSGARGGGRPRPGRHRAAGHAGPAARCQREDLLPGPRSGGAPGRAIQALGFGWIAINATAIFQAGARSVDAMIDALGALHGRLAALG